MNATFSTRLAQAVVGARPLTVLFLGCLILSGCARDGVVVGEQNPVLFWRPRAIINDPSRVGTVSMAVVSVSEWTDIERALQPQFKLDEAAALQAVVPTVGSLSQSRFRGRSLGLGIGLPTQTTRDTSVVADELSLPLDADGKELGEGGGTRTLTRERSEESMPGQAPAPRLPEVTRDAELAEAAALGVEPGLQYSLATALIQQVQLTNRYVQDRVRIDGYVPYVVRLKTTMMPHHNEIPVDAYFDVTFIPATVSADDKLQLRSDEEQATLAFQEATQASKTGNSNPQTRPADRKASEREKLPPPRSPVVLPLLMSDSIEGMQRAFSDEQVTATALAVTAAVKNVGLSLDASEVVAELQRRFGRNYNSTLSVARLNGNTVRIRFGAAVQPTKQGMHAQVTREHVVSLVLMVPSELIWQDVTVLAVGRVHYRRTADGRRLGSGELEVSGERRLQELARVLGASGEAVERLQKELRNLRAAVSQTRLEEFVDLLSPRGSPAPTPTRAALGWLSLQGAIDGPWLLDRIQFRYREPNLTYLPKQMVLLDDGAAARIVLDEAKHFDRAVRPRAVLLYEGNDADVLMQHVPARGLAVSPDGTTMSITFPSLSKPPVRAKDLAKSDPSPRILGKDWRLELAWSVPPGPGETAEARERVGFSGQIDHLFTPKQQSADAAGAKVTASAGAVVVRPQRPPTLVVEVTELDSNLAPVYLRVRNADLVAIEAANSVAGQQGQNQQQAAASPAIVLQGGTADQPERLTVVRNGSAALVLDNVVPGLPVEIQTYRLGEGGKEIAPTRHLSLAVVNSPQ